jgi:spermidine synthase
MKLKFQNLNIQSALALSAASALIYEVVATNVLFFYFIKSSYSIATVLSVFLLGLGIGSLIIYKVLNRIKNKKILFGAFQIIIAVYSFLVLANLLIIAPQLSAWSVFTASFAILLLPTIFLGAAFPLAASIFKKERKEIVGLVYASDLFGAIAGTILAGFLFIPLWGNKVAILFAVGFNLLSAFIILSKRYKIIPIIITCLLVITGLLLTNTNDTTSTSNANVELNNNSTNTQLNKDIQFEKNSAFGKISVINNRLFIEERMQCSFPYPNTASQRKMANYALNPISRDKLAVLNIGLGCGNTALEALKRNGITVDIVEINPVVVDANRQFSDVQSHIAVDLIIDDGLNYLRKTDKTYDSILMDIENPVVAHSSNLYTVDAFKIIFDRLTSDGTFALWNFSNKLNNRYIDILYYSLKETFPYVYIYEAVFIASKQKLDKTEYETTTPYEINTIDKNTLTQAYLES